MWRRVRRIVIAVGSGALLCGLVAPTGAVIAAPQSVLMVVGSPATLTSGDAAVRTRLQGAGFDVVLADDGTVMTADTAGRAFVLVTSSVNSAVLGSRLSSAPVPLWVAKSYSFDDHGLTGTQAGVDYESKQSNVVTIVSPGHPMAAGRTGDVAIQTGNNRVSWGRPPSSATVVATAGGTDATIFTIPAGATLAGGATAAGCRLTFPLFGNSPAAFTADGWALFDAAATWAAGNCGGAPTDSPPTVAITAPPSGATVSGTSAVTANATDDHGVTSVAFTIDGSSIGTDTNGADGWSTAWDTTTVADGGHAITATATDTASQTATATRPVTVVNTDDPPVVMVVASPAALTAGENAVRQRLLGTGYEVVVVDDGSVTAGSVAGSSFVIVSSSVDSTLFGTRLLTTPRPVWLAKPYLFDDYKLTGTQAEVDYGSKVATSLTIAAAGHPLAAGRTGTVSFQSGHNRVSWGRPAAAATVVATAGTDAAIFTIPNGAPLVGGQAAAGCRMSFPLYTNAPTAFTSTAWMLFDAAASWAAAGCDDVPPPPPGDVEHVVFVSLDGFNPQAVTMLGPAGSPTFHQLMSQGASTLNARTTVEQTRTLPNHASMASGRKVATPGGHGVTFSDDNGSTIHASAGGYVASIFDVVHDNGGSTAMYATGKSKFDFLDRSWNATNGAPDVTGADNGRDKIDAYQVTDSAANLSSLLSQLGSANPRTFNFVHFADPDTAGHASGFLSSQYLQAVTRVDGYLGQILDVVATDPDLSGQTVVIVTSDHGGAAGSLDHGDPTLVANYRVPFFAWGAGVASGADLYALNPDRLDPGTAQPPYTAPVLPIRTGEAANLIADLLGYGPIPGTTFNTDLSLDVSTP
jgi:hypothetical protein